MKDEALPRFGSQHSGIAVIVVDNYAVEDFPATLPIVVSSCCRCNTCAFSTWYSSGELWQLTPLAEWLLRPGEVSLHANCAALGLPGAVASPMTPVATAIKKGG